MTQEELLQRLGQGSSSWNKWRKANHQPIDLRHANLIEMDLRDVDLHMVDLSYALLTGAMLQNADFRHAHLSGATLRGAHLSGANMQYAILRDAVLSQADFRHANLGDADLRNADLKRVLFYGAVLTRANFRGAVLNSASLVHADLRYADLRDAELAFADLTSAALIGANLENALLTNACFKNAVFGNTGLDNLDLREALELESVKHTRPSSIGIDSLYKSKAEIPEIFLRECGVPDSFITQAKALIGAEEGIQFYSCFISYSGLDEEFARRLHGRLQQEHVRVWFAPHDIQGGKKLHEQIEEAIRVFDKLLILLSQNSLKSEWVMTELRKARMAERKTGKRKLFPVRLVDYDTLKNWECFDADGGQDLAVEVRQYYIPDFSKWKDHDAFEDEFGKLLKSLRADEKAKV